MAIHDHERHAARDYMHDARNNDDDVAQPVLKWVGVAGFIFLLGFILFIFLAAPSQDPTGGTTRSPTTTTVPQSPTPSPTGPTTQPQ